MNLHPFTLTFRDKTLQKKFTKDNVRKSLKLSRYLVSMLLIMVITYGVGCIITDSNTSSNTLHIISMVLMILFTSFIKSKNYKTYYEGLTYTVLYLENLI